MHITFCSSALDANIFELLISDSLSPNDRSIDSSLNVNSVIFLSCANRTLSKFLLSHWIFCSSWFAAVISLSDILLLVVISRSYESNVILDSLSSLLFYRSCSFYSVSYFICISYFSEVVYYFYSNYLRNSLSFYKDSSFCKCIFFWWSKVNVSKELSLSC